MKKSKRYLLILATLCSVFACKNESKTNTALTSSKTVHHSIPKHLPNSEAGAIAKKAIEFAGGWMKWRDKKTLSYTKNMHFFDSLSNQLKEVSQLHQYQLQPSFKAAITWQENGIEYQIVNNGKQAWKLENGELMQEESHKKSAWNSSFGSHYVMCMLFKLADPGVILSYEGLDTLANKKTVHVLKVTYKKFSGSSGGMHTWWYYFDKDSYQPMANFLDYGDGYSYTEYESFTEVDSLKLNHVRKSYKSDENRDIDYLSTLYTNDNIRFNLDFEEGLFEVKQ